MKWLVTLFVVLAILSFAGPQLRRRGLGKLPGDFRMPMRGRVYYIPFASTILLSLLVWLLGKVL